MSVAAGAVPTPFKGLAAFQDTELDALLFYGREREREVVVANLMASRLTVLYGPSGVGKTSLLRAAVAHSIRAVHDAAVVVFSSWADDPNRGLKAAIEEAVGFESEGALTDTLSAAARIVAGDICVILDQFEEFFLYHESDGARGGFAGELAAAIREPGLRANFLLGLREDALAKLDAFKGQIPNIFANYLRLDHLDRRGGRAAILGPIERYNELTGESVRAEPELVEAVLDQVAAGKVDIGQAGKGGVEADEERVEAPYLQLVMERLWEAEREAGSSLLRWGTFRELGGADAIVRAHLERALGQLDAEEQDVAATMFDHLVTPSGSKIAHRPHDLAQYASVPEGEVVPVLSALERERIVRAVDGAGTGERYEIFHDVLADAVLAWRARRQVDRERQQAQRRNRTLLLVMGATILALAGMTAVAVYALTQRSHARSEARQARARALEATAFAELSRDPLRALADAVEAARADPSGRAEGVLRRALIDSRLRRVLPALAPVSLTSFARHGGKMLTAGEDGRVRIYSAHDDRLLRTLRQESPVEAASFSPDGKVVVTAAGHAVRLWDAASGKRLRTLPQHGSVTSASFSADGRLVLTTSTGRFAGVWRASTGRLLRTLHHPGAVFAGTFSPNGRLVATIGADRARHRVWVFDSRSGRLLHVLPRIGVTGATFSPDGRLLAVASYHGTSLWRPQSGRSVRLLDDGGGKVNEAVFSPDGSLLATAGEDGAVRVWTVADGDRLYYFTGHTNPVLAVAWSPDGRFLADASLDRTAHISEVEGVQVGERVATLGGHRAGLTSIAYSPDGHSLVTGSADGTARVWDARAEQELQPLGAHPGGAVTASFGSGGRLVISAGRDGTARIWDVRRRRLLHTLRHPGPVNDARFSPDGRLVVTVGSDGRARLWDTATGALRRTLGAGRPVLVARFSPDGSLVATGRANGEIQLWKTRNGRLLATAKEPGHVTDLAFAPDGKSIAAAVGDGAAVLSAEGDQLLHRLRSPGGTTRVAFSPDGTIVATAGRDGAARIWDPGTGKLRHVLRVTKVGLTDVVFSPDGRSLLTTSLEPDVSTWDVGTGKQLHLLVGHFGTVSSGAFSPDGRWIVTGGPTSAILWKTGAERPFFYLRGDTNLLTSVSFNPDGKLILSSSKDGSVRLYTCEVCGNLPALVDLAQQRLAKAK
jgi:WD40 repeat protein